MPGVSLTEALSADSSPSECAWASFCTTPSKSLTGSTHRRTSYPLSTRDESPVREPSDKSSATIHRNYRPPHRYLPLNKPTRSNAVHREPLGSCFPPRFTSTRTNLVAELMGTSPMASDDFSRHPVPGSGSGIGSPTRTSLTRSPVSKGSSFCAGLDAWGLAGVLWPAFPSGSDRTLSTSARARVEVTCLPVDEFCRFWMKRNPGMALEGARLSSIIEVTWDNVKFLAVGPVYRTELSPYRIPRKWPWEPALWRL